MLRKILNILKHISLTTVILLDFFEFFWNDRLGQQGLKYYFYYFLNVA